VQVLILRLLDWHWRLLVLLLANPMYWSLCTLFFLPSSLVPKPQSIWQQMVSLTLMVIYRSHTAMRTRFSIRFLRLKMMLKN